MSKEDYETDMQTIRDYVDAVIENKAKIATAYLSAISNFETTVQSASKAEAKPDVLGVVMKSALKQIEKVAVTAIKDSSGADLGPVVDMVHGIYDEIDRAAKAANNLAVAEWIKGLRTSITNAYTRDQKGVKLRQEIEEAYNKNDEGGRGGYIGGVQIELEALGQLDVPTVQAIEVTMYESWINNAFKGDCMDGTGTIVINFNDEDKLDSATVNAPLGDKLATALNACMSGAGINRLMDLNVVKKLTYNDHSMCFEDINVIRAHTDDVSAKSFLTSSNTWELARQFD